LVQEAVGDLEKNLDRNGQPIDNRPELHYSVAVCGERLPFKKQPMHGSNILAIGVMPISSSTTI
jgi:hypothetical protein